VDNENSSMEPVKVPHSLHSFHRIVDTEHEVRIRSLQLLIVQWLLLWVVGINRS
jgi:hypothetical protein